MPVHSAEETTSGSITDKVAKESKDSNASTHPMHDEENQATSGGSVAANAHKANPVRSTPSLLDRIQHAGWTLTGRQGPVHADNLPEPATKEELKKRAEELNK
ncbi:hypothetical protein N0V87_002337 [Didymella glomerata]|uniref:Uncharacterized protein n=1 Tax=Didymella glomerata TaxID=749621 RepID=A0A9W8X485_9PLEO|nr:hypothetical protein N0V87_002337 [Didymella glomerata]